LAGDRIAHAARIKAQEELYRAAVAAMRLLQDRQQHIPEEHLDSRERKVLRQLSAAVAATVLGDPTRAPEVREEVERELGGPEA